jgi:Aldo/keto reductase family
MIKRPFGWTNVEVPVIGQGTWMIEGDPDREKRAVETLRLGLDLGLTHIDTAEMYGEGRVEQLVAEAIAGRRDEVFLASKVLPSNASYEGTLKACESSLKTPSDGLARPLHFALGGPASDRRNDASHGEADRTGPDPLCGSQQLRCGGIARRG